MEPGVTKGLNESELFSMKNMIDSLVGTLVNVSTNELEVSSIEFIFIGYMSFNIYD